MNTNRARRSRKTPKDIIVPHTAPGAGTSITAKFIAMNAALDADAKKGLGKYQYPLSRAEPPAGVIPKDRKVADVLAMDSLWDACAGLVEGGGFNGSGVWQAFPGYPYLAQLTQLPEYRKMVGTRAKEMTRKWVKVINKGKDDKTDKIQQLEEAMRRYKLRDKFRQVAELDGYFGRAHLYIDLNMPGGKTPVSDAANKEELALPLLFNEKKITPKSLNGFVVVEPMWTYPSAYNSTAPLSSEFYRPTQWYVMSQTVHESRLLTFVLRPVPDMLKASYSFGGLSLTQIAQPYVDHWIRTRDSVSDVVHSFSMSGLATNMQTLMSGIDTTGGDLINRAMFFNKMRDNRGLMLTDKDSEEFYQFNTPLAGLDDLQAQSQEQMASVSGIPLVKLLGITPAGLNASADGEIRVFYDDIHADCETLFRDPLKACLEVIQLSEFGEIDSDLDFEFEPLYQLSALEKAQQGKLEADTSVALVGAGVIANTEARVALIANPDSPYASLPEVNDDVQPADVEEEGDSPDPLDTKGVAANSA